MTIDYETLADAIVKGDQQTATTLVQQSVDAAKANGADQAAQLVNAKEVLNKGLIGGMDIISDLSGRGEDIYSGGLDLGTRNARLHGNIAADSRSFQRAAARHCRDRNRKGRFA